MVKKILGIVLSVVGLAALAVTSFKGLSEKYLSSLPIQPKFVMIAGLGLIIVGVILTFDKGGSGKGPKQAAAEVPIYAGDGKHRRIIGYKKG